LVVRARRRLARAGVATGATLDEARRLGRGGWQIDGATVFSAFVVVLFAWALWQGRAFGPRAGLFPWSVCVPGILIGLAQLARDLTGRREARADAEPAPDIPPDVAKRRTTEICVWIGAFGVAIWLLGFSLGTLIATVLYLKVSARERWLLSVVLALASFAFVYGLFEKALGVPFPPGQLFVWLGREGWP